MRCMTIVRAMLVRVLFACHGIMAIWRLYMVTRHVWCWYLGGALFGLFIESLITIAKNKGKEWKWFCPSVFFYLASVVPAIWFLELHEMEARIELRSGQLETSNTTNITVPAPDKVVNNTDEDLKLIVDGIGLDITIPIALPSDLWLRVLEQFLLLMLIIGRWILPKGSISHDQLSQLLLVYVGTAADIVEFYEAFSEEEVKYNRLLCYIVLGIWSLSLLQFTMVLTATKARRDQVGLPMQGHEFEDDGGSCCNPELYGILTSIVLQDLPFLCVRLMLIFKYHVVSYTNFFFTSKNSIVIILLLYRLIVVNSAARKRRREKQRKNGPSTKNNDINANGRQNNFQTPRPLHNNAISRSTPNVYQCDERNKRKHAKHDKNNSSNLSIPTTYSDSSLRKNLNRDKRKSSSPALIEKIKT